MQKESLLYWGVSLLGLWLVISCATPRQPEGGPNDTQAPQFHKKRYSTPDKMTNFREQEVILTFDEWVKLVQAQQKILISPPLTERPDIKVINKSVVVRFKEELKANTTYTISFADVVQDITENNAVENLKRVFATGPYLDSLTVAGEIIDAETAAPKKGVWVMLYDNLEDSVVYKEKPYYVTKVDEQGRFLFENIKNDTFKIVALDDKNNNFLFDLPTESIAFFDSSFVLTDSTQLAFRLRMFQEEAPLLLIASELEHYGAAKFEFNHAHDDRVTIQMLNPPDDLVQYWEYGKDTIRLWFDGTLSEVEDWEFEVLVDSLPIDTVAFVAEDRTLFIQEVATLTTLKKPNKKIELQHPRLPVELAFNRPISSIDSSLIMLKQRILVRVEDTLLLTSSGDTLAFGVDSIFLDSINLDSITIDTIVNTIEKDSFAKQVIPKYVLDSNKIKTLSVIYDWDEEEQYELSLRAGAVQDIYGLSNEDTLVYAYDINVIDEYGNIETDIVGADSTMQYVIQLIKDETQVLKDTIVEGIDSLRLTYYYLEAGSYTIRILHDQNKNGRWDVGTYSAATQAEKISNSKVIQLKAGWDNEMLIDLSPPKSPKKEEEDEQLPDLIDKDKPKEIDRD